MIASFLNEFWAYLRLFGRRAILGFDDRNIQPAAFTMNMKDADGKAMRIEFVLPGSRIMDMAALDDEQRHHHEVHHVQHAQQSVSRSRHESARVLAIALISVCSR